MREAEPVLQNGWKMCCGHSAAVAQLKRRCTTAAGNAVGKSVLERRNGNTMSGPWHSSRVYAWKRMGSVNGANEAEHRKSGMPVPVADFGPTTLHTRLGCSLQRSSDASIECRQQLLLFIIRNTTVYAEWGAGLASPLATYYNPVTGHMENFFFLLTQWITNEWFPFCWAARDACQRRWSRHSTATDTNLVMVRAIRRRFSSVNAIHFRFETAFGGIFVKISSHPLPFINYLNYLNTNNRVQSTQHYGPDTYWTQCEAALAK